MNLIKRSRIRLRAEKWKLFFVALSSIKVISKRFIYTVLIVGSLILSFEVFTFTKLSFPLVGVRAVSAAIGYFLFIFRPSFFPRKISYLILGFLLLGIYSVLLSNYTVGQPVSRSLFTNYRYFLVGEVFFIYYLFRKSNISVDRLNGYLYKLGFVLLFLYYVISFFKLSIATVGEEVQTGIGKLPRALINLIAFLQLGRFFREHKIKFLLLALLLLSVDHIEDIQRAFLSSFVLVVILFSFLYRNQPRILIYSLFALIFLPVLFYIVFTSTNLGVQLQDKFSTVFELFESSNPTSSDPSVNIRIFEVETAYKYISQYPITGTGMLSRETLDRLTNNAHFFSSDIGVVGIYMNFGLFGLFLFFTQIRIGIKELFRLKDATAGYNAYMIYALLLTFITGITMYNPSYFLVIFIIIEYHRYKTYVDAHSGHSG